MRMRKLASMVAAATMVVVGLAASPAQADTDDCPSGGLCAWTVEWGHGTRGVVYQNNRDLLQYYAFNNAEAVWNWGKNCNVRLYSGTGYTGSSYVLQRGYGTGVLQGTAYYHNVASNKWCV